MHPILFTLGPLTIYSYGVCVALGFLLGIITAASRVGRYGWKAETVYDLCFHVLIAAIIGSRALYVLVNPAEFIAHPWEVFMIWRGGLVYFGGLLAAVAAGAIFLRRRGIGIAGGFDLIVPSVALGHAVGRVGCYLNGCCFGTISFIPWAAVFPEGSPAYLYQLYNLGFLPPGRACSFPVHPVQLYASLMELSIFVALLFCLARRRFDGQVFWLYIFLYGTGRFMIEFLRADNRAVAHLGVVGLSLPQLMSLAGVALAAVVLVVKGREKGRAG